MLDNYTVLITGGAGFVGSNLIESLLKKGYTVLCIDDLSTGSEYNINELKNENFSFIKCNINNTNKLKEAVRSINIEYVVHCAATVGVRLTQENPNRVLNDLIGLKNILDNARNKSVTKLINLSSCEVYGDSNGIKFSEKSPINIKSLYAYVKISGEILCTYYSQKYDIKSHNLRLFNLYGKKQRCNQYGFVVGKFISNALQGKDIVVYSDGQQTRDFTYINDVVGIVVNLLERNNIASKTLNIGTGRQTRIIDLAKKIVLLSNSKSKIRLYDSKKDYIIKRCADINLLNRLLERPKLVSLDEGLKNTIKWYRNYNECLNSNSRI